MGKRKSSRSVCNDMNIKNEFWIFAAALIIIAVILTGPAMTGNVVQQTIPTYDNVKVTHYYAPSETDFIQWHNPDYGIGKDSLYYCEIPENKRGFYEEVKCQGSGVGTDNKIYKYDTIKQTKEESVATDKVLTATGTEATPHRTIAVAPGMIPYGSKVYVKFKDCQNPECCQKWEGEYTAEDTGQAMTDDWKKKVPHIDLYTGVGKASLQEAACLPDYAELYVAGMPIHGSAGIYAVRPSFETTVDYDFSDYDRIKQGIEKLNQTCITAGADDIEGCIKENIKKVSSSTGLSWSLGSCDTGEKALFYSFVEAYTQCYFSIDNDCYCKAEIHKDETLDGDYSIRLEDAGVFTASLGKYSQELEGHRLYTDNSLAIFESNMGKMNIDLKFDKGQIKEQKFQTFFTAEKESFVMYKNESKVAIVAKVQEKQNIPDKLLCKIRKDHFQFCAVNNEKKFPRINEKGKLETAPITYKFAVIFKDTVPPPKITTLTAKDRQAAEKSLTLEWKKSEAKDTNGYIIYISKEQFTNIINLNVNPMPKIKSDEETIQANISVEEDDKPYYIAVTAIDNDNNELPDVNSVQGVSLDDLGPAKPSVGAYNKEMKEITIQLPVKNIDDTDIQEQELYIYIRKIPISAPNELDCTNPEYATAEKSLLLKGRPGERKTESIELERGCYLFTAEDEKGNVKLTKNTPNLAELVGIEMVE
jgi:3D (Asp-Asp-Asp) domain-containing protein